MSDSRPIVAAMSGGVDSAVAAAILAQQGWDVIGITLKLWDSDPEDDAPGGCCSLGAVEDARRAAAAIGIPHYVLDMRAEFESAVVEPFVREYGRGRTPNPCIECNRSVKFGALLRGARDLGAEFVATGHYARNRFDPSIGRFRLLTSANGAKDQTYALSCLSQDQLAHALFPLGDIASKAETRAIAARLGLAVAAKRDSQEICFVPREGYVGFIRDRSPEAMRPGAIVSTDGQTIGMHDGISSYTIGQRRRLPASSSGPLFVVGLKPETNQVIVGREADLWRRTFAVREMNWISVDQPIYPLAVSARIRYNAPAEPAVVLWNHDAGGVECRFESPQRAITPGQAAVFYSGDDVLGGGTIDAVVRGNAEEDAT